MPKFDKPSKCDGCPMKEFGEGFVPIVDIPHSTTMLVAEAPGEEEMKYGLPLIGGSGQWLNNMLKHARLNRDNMCIANTILCRPPANIYPTDPKASYIPLDKAQEAVAHCRREYLDPYLASRDWRKIYALGNKALAALTKRNGIELWRGSPLPLTGGSKSVVIPTLHPAYLMRQASLTSVVIDDFRKHPTPPPENYNLYPTLEDLRGYRPKRLAFDFEWDWAGNITLCGLSSKLYEAIVVPWEGEFIEECRRIFENAEVLIGHNIVGADTRYIERLGWNIKARLLDTMLAQHLVQPDMRHGLAFVASVFTNKVFWKGKETEDEDTDTGSEAIIGKGAQYKTWDSPDAIPRELGGYGGCKDVEEAYRLYNARDTDASFQIAYTLENSLQRYNLENTYSNVSVPIAFICRDLGDRGIKIDKSKLVNVRDDLDAEITRLDALLPDGLRSYTVDITKQEPAPPGTYKPGMKVCKGRGKNTHDRVEFSFNDPTLTEWTCPHCSITHKLPKLKECKVVHVPATRCISPWNSSDMVMEYAKSKGLKEVYNPKTGNPSADKNARKVWGRKHLEFTTVDQLKQHITLRNNFAKPGLITTDRMYFNLLPHGTGEGRLSSTGKRRGIDLNVQNIPAEMKVIFVPDYDDWSFLDFDISQGENRLTAWFAKDFERLERLKDPLYDEHSETATECFGVPVSKKGEHSHLRKPGKIINHMLNYGAGYKKLREQLAVEGYYFSESDCKDMIAAWRRKNAVTAQWQADTIATAQRQGWLANPFGRRRWFQTRDLGPKALAFLPASTLADCMLRVMIAMHSDRFTQECNNLGLLRRMVFGENWRMVCQVHDSIVATGPTDLWEKYARMMIEVMSQPWAELDGFAFSVEGKVCKQNLGEGEKIKL